MKPRFLILVLSASLLPWHGPAAELSATGISIPFFNREGKLTHRMMAKAAVRSGQLQKMQQIEVHYFAADDPRTIVQKIQANDATWDDRRETLVGDGTIVLATVESRLTGEGFDFSLSNAVVRIHREFTLTNDEVRLTSNRAVIELIVDQANDQVKVRDVKRCEAIGNLHIVVQPSAQPKYRVKEAFSDLAIYQGATGVISLPNPTRTLQADGGEGHFQTLTINLRDSAKK